MKVSFRTRIKIVLFLFGAIFLLMWVHFLKTPIIQKEDVHYILRPGTSARQLSNDLSRQADLKSPWLFLSLVKLFQGEQRLKAGEYIFSVGSKPFDILRQVINGKVVYHKLVIVEGRTFKEIMQEMNQSASIEHLLNGLSTREVSKELGIDHETPEGLLLPDTYYYTLGTTDLELLQRAYQAMKDYVETAWILRDLDCGCKKPYQALIIASMVEKETAIKEEKPLVAAVISKRLKKRMRLQIDATVIYGLGERYAGKLTKEDLRLKTPYNTYTRYGLPPTPISMPNKDSIQAALHPAETDALYFAAKNDGHHEFSANLMRHNRVVQTYLKK